MSGGLLVAFVVAVFSVLLLHSAIIVVPDGGAWIVERLGRYHRTLPAGLHVITPFIDRVAFRYSLLPKAEEFSDQCVTRDDVPVRITSTVRAQIHDPRQAAYASAHAGDSLVTLVRTHQRQRVGETSWDDLRLDPRALERAVVGAAAQPAEQLGVRLLALDVKDLERVV